MFALINRARLQPSSFSMTGHASGQDSSLATTANSFFFLPMGGPFASWMLLRGLCYILLG